MVEADGTSEVGAEELVWSGLELVAGAPLAEGGWVEVSEVMVREDETRKELSGSALDITDSYSKLLRQLVPMQVISGISGESRSYHWNSDILTHRKTTPQVEEEADIHMEDSCKPFLPGKDLRIDHKGAPFSLRRGC